MKKVLFLLICMAIFAGCSSDEASSLNTEGSRLKKTVQHQAGETYVVNLVYGGDKMVKQITPSGEIRYYFTGDLMTKVVSSYTQLFEYDSQGRLTKFYTPDGEDVFVTNYTYNADGTVDCEEKFDGVVRETRRLYFANGELVQKDVTRWNSDLQQWESSSFYFTYDDMNAPDVGVGRWIFNYMGGFGYGVYPNHHNLVSIHQEFNGEEATWGYEYTYNSLGYPTTATQMNNDWEPSGLTSEYFYE